MRWSDEPGRFAQSGHDFRLTSVQTPPFETLVYPPVNSTYFDCGQKFDFHPGRYPNGMSADIPACDFSRISAENMDETLLGTKSNFGIGRQYSKVLRIAGVKFMPGLGGGSARTQSILHETQ